jgi:Protein of unknown function (DUF3617)
MKTLSFTFLLALTACGQGNVDLKNASVEEVAKASANVQAINPGQWTTETVINAVDMPGVDPQTKAMMSAMTKAMVGKKKTSENCITPEQAKKPTTDMFAAKESGNCTFEHYTLNGGKMDAVLKCASPGRPGEMTMAMSGEYGGDSFALTSQIKMSGGPAMAGGAGMTITSTNTGKRIGACKPS